MVNIFYNLFHRSANNKFMIYSQAIKIFGSTSTCRKPGTDVTKLLYGFRKSLLHSVSYSRVLPFKESLKSDVVRGEHFSV